MESYRAERASGGGGSSLLDQIEVEFGKPLPGFPDVPSFPLLPPHGSH